MSFVRRFFLYRSVLYWRFTVGLWKTISNYVLLALMGHCEVIILQCEVIMLQYEVFMLLCQWELSFEGGNPRGS